MRRFGFTVPDAIGIEIEQYCYGKYGVIPSKALPGIVLAIMSKNPLTEAQITRIVERYGDKAVALSKRLSGTAEGKNEGDSQE